jgi:hypothetical protein
LIGAVRNTSELSWIPRTLDQLRRWAPLDRHEALALTRRRRASPSRALGPIPARRSSPLSPAALIAKQLGMRSTSEPYVFHVSSHVSHIRTIPVPIAPVPHQNHACPAPIRTCRLSTAPAVIHIEGSCRPNAAHPKFKADLHLVSWATGGDAVEIGWVGFLID